MEPQESLPGASQLRNVVEDEQDRFLDAPVGILLVSITGLHETDGGGNDKVTSPRLRVARGKRTLPKKIKLILVEAALRDGDILPKNSRLTC